MTEWGEPIEGSKSGAHDWNREEVLIATFDRTDLVDVPDASKPLGVRESKIHRFLRDGEIVDVWGSADLDPKVKEVRSGQLVRIVYLGLEDIGNDRQMKRFELRVATSQPAATSVVDDDVPF